MKIRPFLIFALLIGVVSMFAFYPNDTEDPKVKEALIIKSILAFFSEAHFSPEKIDKEFSKKVFNDYLEYLDSGKRFLTQEDISKLKKFENRLDKDLPNGNFEFLDLSIELINKSNVKVQKMINEILSHPMTFNTNEVYNFDYETMPYTKNNKELQERIRLALKADVLDEIVILQKVNNSDSITVKSNKQGIKTFSQIETEAREKIKKDMITFFERASKLKRSDRLNDYLNIIASTFDPHSGYFSPTEKEDFNISMSGKLEGIGARLQPDGDYTKVNEIVPGGPAWKQKELEVNDLIIKVAQENGEPVDIRGLRIDEVVSKIRGKKGTKVKLTVKKVSGNIIDIIIVRDEVLMEEGFAKSLIINKKDVLNNVGYIYLPRFYANLEDKSGRFCYIDVVNEIKKLKAHGVDGMILDLRNNPGGSLNEVVKMSGLFIEEGPIVQVKSREREAYKMNDTDPNVQYDGPLVILVNHNSASASEIIAAAMQDYNRAIIVGSTSTYGKGTVQRFVNLDDAINGQNDLKPLGEAKLTIQKYYRIDGGSTQLKGVVPDVILPDSYNYISMGEKDNKHALAWTQVPPASYNQEVFVIKNKNEIIANSNARIEKNEKFKMVDENAKRYKYQYDHKFYSLQIDQYKKDLEKRKTEDKKFNALFSENPSISVENLNDDLPKIKMDAVNETKNKNFITNIKKDIYIDESINILKDLQVNKMTTVMPKN